METVEMVQPAESFDTFLNALKQLPDLFGGIIIDQKGSVISHNFSEKAAAESLAVITKTTTQLVGKFTREAQVGYFRTIFLTGTFGRIYIIRFDITNRCAVIFGNDNMKIGLISALYTQYLSK
jgi:predicted regulator of Ras-like GTPase activity (Roadblock/LC7/MglB family)